MFSASCIEIRVSGVRLSAQHLSYRGHLNGGAAAGGGGGETRGRGAGAGRVQRPREERRALRAAALRAPAARHRLPSAG